MDYSSPNINNDNSSEYHQHHNINTHTNTSSKNNNNNIIKLNVGGKKYMTTKQTLTSKGDNFFTCMLNGSIPSAQDEKGYHFIDRNGRYFEYILEYLRTGYVELPNDIALEAVFREADFYSIVGFQLQWIQQQIHKSHSSRQGSQNELVAQAPDTTDSLSVEDVQAQHNAAIHNLNNIVTNNRRNNVNNTDYFLRLSLGLVSAAEKLLKIY